MATLSELMWTLEQVSLDPDAPITQRQAGILASCAVGGALIGLEHGRGTHECTIEPDALEIASQYA